MAANRSVLILGNRALDLRRIVSRIMPGVGQILSAERRIACQQHGLGHPESSRLFQGPDRDAGADHPGLTPADARCFVDAWCASAQIQRDPLQQLRLLSRRESRQNFVDGIEPGCHGVDSQEAWALARL